jgi:hypothetical protein
MDHWQTQLCLENKSFTIVGDSDIWNFNHYTPEGLLVVQHSVSQQLRTIHDGDSILYNLD